MSMCKKCWRDAGIIAASKGTSKADEYQRLIDEREPCTPKEQAGCDAEICASCGRRAVHEDTRICMACGRKGGA